MSRKTIKDLLDCAQWYARTWAKLQADYGICAHLMAGLIAATSPQRKVKENLHTARKILECIVSDKDWREVGGILPCHFKNIERAISGAPLHGGKVKAFYENLTGNLDSVTIDTWMLKFFKFSGWITPRRYEKFQKRVIKNARRHGLKPAEYQAIIWVKMRGLETAKTDMFDGVDYV
jgi:hypothetical protein